MNIHEVLKKENIDKTYKCDYDNRDYKVIQTGKFLGMANAMNGIFIAHKLSLEVIINSEYEEIL